MTRIRSRAMSIDSENHFLSNTNPNPPQKKSKKVPKILDGRFFAIDRSDASGVIVAKCCLCESDRKSIHGKSGSTGNFWDHLRRIHPGIVENARLHVRTDTTPNKDSIGKAEVSLHNLNTILRIMIYYLFWTIVLFSRSINSY